MLFYFAYGANMDVTGMRARCPRSVPLGPARLAGYSFFVMADGYGSIEPKPGSVVHGLAWKLHRRDLGALDLFESVETDLYVKRRLPVQFRGVSRGALVYIGFSVSPGQPVEGYMEAVVTAATRLRLPATHICGLRGWLPLRQQVRNHV